MRKKMSTQNLVLIRSAEDPADFANFGGTGYYPPPWGTAKTATNTLTLDNSSTPADNTPGEPINEIVREKATFNWNDDEDNKEGGDLSGRELTNDPGKKKIDIALEVWEERGTNRTCTAKCFHPTKKEYKDAVDYPRFDVIVVGHPMDASDVEVTVDEKITKSDFTKGNSVQYFRDVVFASKAIALEQGEKIKAVLSGMARELKEYTKFEFGVELLAATTQVGGTPTSLTTQPIIPTRLKLTVSAFVTLGDIILVGKDSRGKAITETITVAAAGTFYSTKVYGSIDASGVQPQGSAAYDLAVNAGELY